MRPRPLSSLGPMVRERRGTRKLREVAREIGIGAATLMRVENGRIPDVTTFGKICQWLEIDPGVFLGFERPGSFETAQAPGAGPLQVSAHFRADQTPQPETAQALAQMILLAARTQPGIEGPPEDGGV
jgi:transcriptional regulator with XRE-family HTH domain